MGDSCRILCCTGNLCCFRVWGKHLFAGFTWNYEIHRSCLYFLWLAVHIALSKPTTGTVEKSVSFLKGFLLQFVNVKIYLFGITALTGYVTEYSASLWVLLLFEIIIATIGTIATLTWIGMGVLIQRAYQKYYRVINIILLTLSECVYALI